MGLPENETKVIIGPLQKGMLLSGCWSLKGAAQQVPKGGYMWPSGCRLGTRALEKDFFYVLYTLPDKKIKHTIEQRSTSYELIILMGLAVPFLSLLISLQGQELPSLVPRRIS